MYAVKILDERGLVDYVTIGNKVKLFGSFDEAQREIELLEQYEETLFGEILCLYSVEVTDGQKTFSGHD
jgi:hypothetical protein